MEHDDLLTMPEATRSLGLGAGAGEGASVFVRFRLDGEGPVASPTVETLVGMS